MANKAGHLDSYGSEVVSFICPGCKGDLHHIRVTEPGAWKWNQSLEAPSFVPSIKVENGRGYICHSYVTNGRIQFLEDCTHDFKGQTVDLPDWV